MSANLEPAKRQFANRWSASLRYIFATAYELPRDIERLRGLADALHESVAREEFGEGAWRGLKNRFFNKLTPAQQALWNHPLAQKLFKIWREHIRGLERGVLGEAIERADFFDYLFQQADIARNPKNSELFERYKTLTFALRMLRPNPVAHMYISYSFAQRPLRGLIAEYMRMATITGEYELLLSRFPPYHQMLNLHTMPGMRTAFDMRGLDFRPVTLPLTLEYTLAVELPKTQLRQAGRYIEINASNDAEAEQFKQAEIEKIEAELAKIFPSPRCLREFQFGEDAKAYSGVGAERLEMQDYGSKRARYLQEEDYLKLFKSIPRPAACSGIRVKFKLREPVAVLLDGIDRKRPLNLGEVGWLLRCLDLYGREADKPDPAQRRSLDEIISQVFANHGGHEYSESTQAFLHELGRIHKEHPDHAWRYLINQLLEGKQNILLAALCHGLTKDGFDLFFSLWPLLTGKELELDPAGMLLEKDAAGHPVANHANHKKVQLLPLLEILRDRLRSLLHDVFAEFVDVSAATKRIRSEPLLAKMVVEECLNLHSDHARFRSQLTAHLRRHYHENWQFMRQVYGDGAELGNGEHILSAATLPLKAAACHDCEHKEQAQEERKAANETEAANSERHKSKPHCEEFCERLLQQDAQGIIRLIDNTRAQLLSRNQCNRLLCFIDAGSVEVMVGDFEYSGAELERETELLEDMVRLKKDMTEHRHRMQETREKLKEEQEVMHAQKEIEKDRAELSKSQIEIEISQAAAVAKVMQDNPGLRDIIMPYRERQKELMEMLNENPMLATNPNFIKLLEKLTLESGNLSVDKIDELFDKLKNNDTPEE